MVGHHENQKMGNRYSQVCKSTRVDLAHPGLQHVSKTPLPWMVRSFLSPLHPSWERSRRWARSSARATLTLLNLSARLGYACLQWSPQNCAPQSSIALSATRRRSSERARIQVMSNFLKINLLSLELQLKSLISIQKSIRLILRETFLKGLSLNSSKTFRFLSSNH